MFTALATHATAIMLAILVAFSEFASSSLMDRAALPLTISDEAPSSWPLTASRLEQDMYAKLVNRPGCWLANGMM
jgi:hypothetical protein